MLPIFWWNRCMCCTSSFTSKCQIIRLTDRLLIHLNNTHMESLYYQFELKVHRVVLDVEFMCDVQIWWKRGNKNKVTSKKYRVDKRVQYIEINEAFKSFVKVKFKDGKPLPYTTDITVLLYSLSSNSNSCKQGGVIQNLDITQIILPQNKKASVSRQFEQDMDNSLPNSKVFFSLSCKFVRQAANQESLNDISFQGTSPNPFNHSQNDMTFRPGSQQRTRKNSRRDVSPVVRANQMEERIQSPLQRVDMKMQTIRPAEQHENNRNNVPLGFSFGPVANPERERQNRAYLDEINSLREQLGNQRRESQRLIAKIRQFQAKEVESEKNCGIDEKKLLLLNQLNAAVNQCDQIKRQRDQVNSQVGKLREDYKKLRQDVKEKEILYGKAKDENRQLTFNFNKLRDELSQMTLRFQAKKKQSEQLRPKWQKMQRQNQQMKNQLFKKQSQLISHQNQLQNVKIQFVNANKNVSIMQELKRVNQDLGKQRAQLQKTNNQMAASLQRQQGLREQLTKKFVAAKEEFQSMKTKFIESYKHQQSHFQFQIREIQTEMNNLMMQKQSADEQHVKQINQLTKRNEQLVKKAQEYSNRNNSASSAEIQSLKIQISQLKVKVKHHEQIYVNLQKDYNDKQKQVTAKTEFIEKVREYVSKIQSQNRQKDNAIRQRDEFIAKAKDFITNKEADMLSQIQKFKKQILVYKQKAQSLQNLRNDVSFLSTQNKQKQKFMGDIIRESNQKQQRLQQIQNENQEMNMILTEMERKISQMQDYIEMQNERFETNMDEVQELNRKIKSQQETLEDLVKKNLDMEIQLNIKNFELKSIKSR